MYGLGIRIGFYLQWYGTILASWLAPSEVPNLRLTNMLFITATLIALIIQRRTLSPPEIYIILLLFFGTTFYLLPVFLWRMVTRFNKRWDPTRFPLAKPPMKVANLLSSLVIITVLSFMLWFWILKVPTLAGEPCERYGFMFTAIQLNSLGFRIFHLVICSVLLLVVPILLIWDLISDAKNTEIPAETYVTVFQAIGSFLNLGVTAVINVAVELTIVRNRIQGIHGVTSAGQLIPFIIGVGAVTRIFYVFLFGEDKDPLEDGFRLEDVMDRLWTRSCWQTVAERLPPLYGAAPPSSP